MKEFIVAYVGLLYFCGAVWLLCQIGLSKYHE